MHSGRCGRMGEVRQRRGRCGQMEPVVDAFLRGRAGVLECWKGGLCSGFSWRRGSRGGREWEWEWEMERSGLEECERWREEREEEGGGPGRDYAAGI